MSKNPQIYIQHILDSIEAIDGYLKGINKKDFLADIEKQDAVIRRIGIIGEAVKNIPQGIKKQNTNIPWRNIAGMRDIVIHEYFDVDLNLAWDTAKIGLPKLKRELMKFLK
ncbi:MAG: DUF86 domain-containing protein [bacterium]